MSNLVKEITNIQTFELLEERLGIRIAGIHATIVDGGSNGFFLSINAEIFALNGGQVEENFEIKITANDSAGKVVGAVGVNFFRKDFFGLNMLNSTIVVYTTDVQAIKVFPVKVTY